MLYKYITEQIGEVQLTKNGLSGICIFNLSHFVTRGLDLGKKEEIEINFVPFVEGNVKEWLINHSKNLNTNILCGYQNVFNKNILMIDTFF